MRSRGGSDKLNDEGEDAEQNGVDDDYMAPQVDNFNGFGNQGDGDNFADEFGNASADDFGNASADDFGNASVPFGGDGGRSEGESGSGSGSGSGSDDDDDDYGDSGSGSESGSDDGSGSEGRERGPNR